MELTKKRCVPCEGGIPPMTDKEEEKYIDDLYNWELVRKGTHILKKAFRFPDFKEAIKFVNKVADLAEDEGHHPNITINYNMVNIELYTHAVGGLTENDFILAAKMDEIE
jgi:4a-hydroxytetrahydrobiopterin dehydratase